jgi:hypothetical protein
MKQRSLLLRRYCWGRRVFGISHRGLETEIWFAVQLPSQESDWSSVEGEAAAIFISSIERSRSYVFCPAKSFLVESILSLSPTHLLHVPNSIASLIPLVDSFWNQCQLCKNKIVDLATVSALCIRGRETDWSRPTRKVYFKNPAHLDHWSGDRDNLRIKLFPSTIHYISPARDLGESTRFSLWILGLWDKFKAFDQVQAWILLTTNFSHRASVSMGFKTLLSNWFVIRLLIDGPAHDSMVCVKQFFLMYWICQSWADSGKPLLLIKHD